MVRDLFQLNTLYKKLFISMVVVLLVLCGTYGFFLKQTVASVVARRSLEIDKRDLSAHVSSLETSYIRATDSLTLTSAYERGFVVAQATRFVSRAPQTFSFDHRSDE